MSIKDWLYRKRGRWLAKQILNIFPNRSTLLNVGSGEGFLEHELGESYKIFSLDPDPIQKPQVNQIESTLDKASFIQKFDGVIFSHSLHHIENPEKAIQKALSLLNASGKVIILDIAPRTTLERILLCDSRILCSTARSTWAKDELRNHIEAFGKIEKVEQYTSLAPMFVVKSNHE